MNKKHSSSKNSEAEKICRDTRSSIITSCIQVAPPTGVNSDQALFTLFVFSEPQILLNKY